MVIAELEVALIVLMAHRVPALRGVFAEAMLDRCVWAESTVSVGGVWSANAAGTEAASSTTWPSLVLFAATETAVPEAAVPVASAPMTGVV